MSSHSTPSPQLPDYPAILQEFLDLAMQVAKSASAEGNHRLVLQAIREGARVVTLILKMTSTSDSGLLSLIAAGRSLNGSVGPDITPANSSPDRHAGNQKPETENHLFKKWEKSGKSAGKKAFQGKDSKRNQTDILLKESSANFLSGTRHGEFETSCESNWLDDLASGRLDFDTLNAIGAGRPRPELLEVFKADISL